MEEAAQRRRLHNALVDMKGAIRVFARLRPPLLHEANRPIAIECDSMGAVVDATTRCSTAWVRSSCASSCISSEGCSE